MEFEEYLEGEAPAWTYIFVFIIVFLVMAGWPVGMVIAWVSDWWERSNSYS